MRYAPLTPNGVSSSESYRACREAFLELMTGACSTASLRC